MGIDNLWRCTAGSGTDGQKVMRASGVVYTETGKNSAKHADS
ncbi:hypothetical protein ALO83_104007 [Pseudomonas cannabina pv. alisalensis]|uniref:Uncharacterized protein n=1 Tax=Pseudomonas cannabina TaxID=86840 RepID=A0A3M3QU89_PSECA|nr:Unknown protein sequence [Pseudomonas syringae pv. maculicola]KPW20699.1 hypothetical protein ALO83_104007 [Pseudomonas cannabina pv. alisalensis]RMN78981.1 hypothetical protein ALQ52_104737 [Pseudomonas cannabina pv. alisalensis]RMN79146.1 hypothetical protein ALQ53_103741 [Pseudomonas cannabina]RMN87610.1 hypothetical protein ALQ51_102335 [Pseudomonas cannabina]